MTAQNQNTLESRRLLEEDESWIHEAEDTRGNKVVMTMENIQADEEIVPLAQPRRRVAEAYVESNNRSRWVARVGDTEHISDTSILSMTSD